ncbi:MAG: hypothetical protein WAO58_12010 [Fimbriimonadaceae bacterium]
MKVLLLLTVLIGQQAVDQPKSVRAPVVGMWKVDLNSGYPKQATAWGIYIDWVLTFNEDGTYQWAMYEPFKEGVGRPHKDIKGTYVVNLEENILVLRSGEGKNRSALKAILDEDRKWLTLPPENPKKPELKVRFYKVEKAKG